MAKPTKKKKAEAPAKPRTTISAARLEAYSILIELERRPDAHADDLLRGSRVTALSAQDRNLCTALVLGVLRWQIRLDAAIRTRLSKPNAKLDDAIRIALRLGFFQLHYLDRIPAHAAISESVSLAKLAGHQHASRMVNAVLRALARVSKPDLDELPEAAAALAAPTAHPVWLVERWVANYGVKAAQGICQNGQRQPELDLRLESPQVESDLAEQGIVLLPGTILATSRRLVSGDVTSSEIFRDGRIRIQEEGSQLIGELGSDGARQPKRILDCCAAPGGKTLILAERNPQAKVTALEISPIRCEALKVRMEASPYAAQIEVRQGDATQLPDAETYDLVLADVPCSGTGTLGRNPEIRHRLQPADLTRHHERQSAILSGVLRVGAGRVIYSTCSLEPEENRAVVAAVLAREPKWRQIPVSEGLFELQEAGRLAPSAFELLKSAQAPDGSLTILPGSFGPEIQTDGFFIAILERLR